MGMEYCRGVALQLSILVSADGQVSVGAVIVSLRASADAPWASSTTLACPLLNHGTSGRTMPASGQLLNPAGIVVDIYDIQNGRGSLPPHPKITRQKWRV